MCVHTTWVKKVMKDVGVNIDCGHCEYTILNCSICLKSESVN